MGLDWMLHGHKPKEGHEKPYRNFTAKLSALDSDGTVTAEKAKALRKDLESALEQVSVSPYQVIGAPRVGIDDEATAWFKVHAFDPMQQRIADELKRPVPRNPTTPSWNERNEKLIAFWNRPFEDVVRDERGKYVVELAKDRAGIAEITGFLTSSLDFRGQAVVLSVVVDADLRSEAYDDHDAESAVAYADRLEAFLEGYKHDHPDWETREETNDWGGRSSAKDDVEEVSAAVRWLRYWGQHGFGFTAWY